MGHEAIGYISELFSAVSGLEVGDYVIIPDTVGHGRLEMEPTPWTFSATELPSRTAFSVSLAANAISRCFDDNVLTKRVADFRVSRVR